MVRGGSGEFELAGARRARWALTGAAVTGRQRAAAGQVEGVTASWEGSAPKKEQEKGSKGPGGPWERGKMKVPGTWLVGLLCLIQVNISLDASLCPRRDVNIFYSVPVLIFKFNRSSLYMMFNLIVDFLQ